MNTHGTPASRRSLDSSSGGGGAPQQGSVKSPALSLRRRARLLIRHLGLDIHRYLPALDVDARRSRLLHDHRVDMVVDGGANRGQWALGIRGSGYRGPIISFEPLAGPFAELCRAAAGDPSWRCVRAALGDADSEVSMNVAGNSTSSSLLPMEPAHVRAAPESVYVGSEVVQVMRLDSVVPEMVRPGLRLALKLDLQGYEAAALAGAEGILADVQLVESELSVVPLYQGQPLYLDMIHMLDGLDFVLASVSEGLTDRATGRVMQLDAIFVRADGHRSVAG